jgi:ATP-dependent Lon protease
MQEFRAGGALSSLRTRLSDLGVPADWFETHEIRLHFPAGAIPKDGPSAGATMACVSRRCCAGVHVGRMSPWPAR